MTTTVSITIPPDWSPENIRGDFIGAKGNERLLSDARTPLAGIYGLGAKINELAGTGVSRPELARQSAPMVARATASLEKAIDSLSTRHAALEKTIADTLLPPGTKDALAAEIRAHFKSRGKTAFTELGEAINAGDRDVVAAVLSGPAFLSGVNQQQRDVLRTQARLKLLPVQHGLAQDLENAVAQMRRVGASFVMKMGTQLHAWSKDTREAEDIRQRLAS